MGISRLLIALLGAIGLLLLVIVIILQRVKAAEPNDAFIITGRKGKPVRNPETGQISTDMFGDVDGVAIVKTGGNDHAIRAGAQRFLDQQDGIEGFTQEVLAGSLPAI